MHEPSNLFPGLISASAQNLAAIKQIAEDKQMYDATEKARRDRQWALNAKLAEGKMEGMIEGKIEGEIKLIRTLEGLWGESRRMNRY